MLQVYSYIGNILIANHVLAEFSDEGLSSPAGLICVFSPEYLLYVCILQKPFLPQLCDTKLSVLANKRAQCLKLVTVTLLETVYGALSSHTD